MPIPKPRKNEDKDKFLNRCMGDSVMNTEFPEQQQRFAVCLNNWKKKEEKSQLEKGENKDGNQETS